MPVEVRLIPPALTHDLRWRLLRQGMPADAARFAGDDDPANAHFGAYLGNRLAGVATLHGEAFEGRPAWRLRGMAVDGDTQGAGVGRALLAGVDAFVARSSVQLLWCHARVPAIRFYERCGWAAVSGVYDIPTAGPHRTMVRRVEISLRMPTVAGS